MGHAVPRSLNPSGQRPPIDRRTLAWVSAAILVGVVLGGWFGNLGREAKQPGEAIRTTDASGHWAHHAEPNVDAEILTNTRIRLVMQALPTYALLHAGRLPDSLEALVSSGLLGSEVIRDGWARQLLYRVDHETGHYSVRSLGADGVASADDIPAPRGA